MNLNIHIIMPSETDVALKAIYMWNWMGWKEISGRIYAESTFSAKKGNTHWESHTLIGRK